MMSDKSTSDDSKLDETLDKTFPASDAPANTVVRGVRLAPAVTAADVTDNQCAQRFELIVHGQTSFLEYDRTPKTLALVHTEVPPPLRGRGLGMLLVEGAIVRARAAGRLVIAVCPFVKAYVRRHPDRAVAP